jgi:hypothetical protein
MSISRSFLKPMADPFGYEGRRAAVTGAFPGIGEATARLLVDLGAEPNDLSLSDTMRMVSR